MCNNFRDYFKCNYIEYYPQPALEMMLQKSVHSCNVPELLFSNCH